MKISELIKILQSIEERDAEIFISESEFEWDDVLVYLPDPSNPDERKEIRL